MAISETNKEPFYIRHPNVYNNCIKVCKISLCIFSIIAIISCISMLIYNIIPEFTHGICMVNRYTQFALAIGTVSSFALFIFSCHDYPKK
jgi:hypothetical protein